MLALSRGIAAERAILIAPAADPGLAAQRFAGIPFGHHHQAAPDDEAGQHHRDFDQRADDRGQGDGDEDGGPGWVYRRAASSARLVARLIAKIDLLSSSSSEGAASCERGLLCVVAVAESTYVGHAFSHELRM